MENQVVADDTADVKDFKAVTKELYLMLRRCRRIRDAYAKHTSSSFIKL